MPRANRYFLPGYIWHITHRCHKREFLLKFAKDRKRWLHWLFTARKRYGLQVLNYVVTSNHIHLLVQDTGGSAISKSLQLVAGRTAQEFNERKGRRGAYWEDRYHATAVESSEHLFKCMTYIDLNMVRAGAVRHPFEWPHGGYREILSPKERYRIIDISRLMEISGVATISELQMQRTKWVADELALGIGGRDADWTESVAVGSSQFIDEVYKALGIKVMYKRKLNREGKIVIQETPISYISHSDANKHSITTGNAH
jgi:REP element-mobilizing transposase RayT